LQSNLLSFQASINQRVTLFVDRFRYASDSLCFCSCLFFPEGDHWRQQTFAKCAQLVRASPKALLSAKQAASIKGIGEKTAEKIEEIIKTGLLDSFLLVDPQCSPSHFVS
jgi:hypothetical protein